MDTLNKVNLGDIRTEESFTEVYNDKGESVSGEKNEHSDGNLSNDNNLRRVLPIVRAGVAKIP